METRRLIVMKPLTTNLKHLYQSRNIWLFNIIILAGFMALFVEALAPGKPERLVLILLPVCIFGIGLGAMVAEAWNKPFVFSLPGQIKTAQKMLLLIWLSLLVLYSFIIAVILLRSNHSNAIAMLAWFIGTISLAYWYGVGVGISTSKFLAGLSFVVVIVLAPYSLRAASVLLTDYTWTVTLISSILSYILYLAINNRDRVRLICNNPLSGFLDVYGAYSQIKQKRIRRTFMHIYPDQRLDHAGESIGIFFSEKILNNNKSSYLAHIWGQSYLVIGQFMHWWPLILLSCFTLIFLCFLCQLKGLELYMLDSFMFIMVGVIGGGICALPRFDHFMLIGRRLYFWRGIVLLITALSMILAFMGILVLLYNALSIIFPSFTLMGKSFEITPINWTLLAFPVMMTPLFGGIIILLKDMPVIRGLTLGILIIAILIILGYITTKFENMPFLFASTIFLLITAFTWGFHILILYYDSMKRSFC